MWAPQHGEAGVDGDEWRYSLREAEAAAGDDHVHEHAADDQQADQREGPADHRTQGMRSSRAEWAHVTVRGYV